jgi:hypothetical protein
MISPKEVEQLVEYLLSSTAKGGSAGGGKAKSKSG